MSVDTSSATAAGGSAAARALVVDLPWLHEDAAFDGAYLLTDVYVSVDEDGPLRHMHEQTISAQTALLSSWRASSAAYASALLAVHETLVQHAGSGSLEDIHELLLTLRSDEVLLALLQRMLATSARAGHLHVCEYLRRRGLKVQVVADESHLVLAVIDAAIDALLEQEDAPQRSSRFARGAAAVRARPVPVPARPASALPSSSGTVLRYLLQCGASGEAMRPHDGYTALHIAAMHGLADCVASLLRHGVDVNPIAMDDATPLACAVRGAGEDPHRAPEFDATIRCLREAGAVLTWREALAAVSLKRRDGEADVKRASTSTVAAASAAASSRPSIVDASVSTARVELQMSEDAVHM